MIPKVIHLVWFQGKEHLLQSRPDFSRYYHAWLELFPGWEVRVWDTGAIEDLLVSHYPKQFTVYQQMTSYAFKSDVARYCIVHHQGGMYADTDYEPLKYFGHLLEGQGFASSRIVFDNPATTSMTNGASNNCWFAAEPGHPALASLIERYEDEGVADMQIVDYFQIFPERTTRGCQSVTTHGAGPCIQYPASMMEGITVKIAYQSCDTRAACLEQFPWAVGIHHMDGSWKKFLEHVGSVMYAGARSTWWILLLLLVVVLTIVVVVLVVVHRKYTTLRRGLDSNHIVL